MKNNELQQRIENIVRNEVLYCQSGLVDQMLSNGTFNYEDIQNLFVDNSEEIEEKQNELSELQEIEEPTQEQEEMISWLENRIEELENEQEEPQEIFEWWIVSNWLLEKLRELGEPILENEYGEWWGRTCTGQSITLDYIIEKIATDLNK